MNPERFTDLDQSPHLGPQLLPLFTEARPGRRHAVCGDPARMGCMPTTLDLHNCLGVLIQLEDQRAVGGLGICAYSDEQATLWGPVTIDGWRPDIAAALFERTRTALREGGYESLRVLVDHRNRDARAFYLGHGLTPWKDDILYRRRLANSIVDPGGVSLATPADHQEVLHLLQLAFPDSGHFHRGLAQREEQGYRHYLLRHIQGGTIACATVRADRGRAWISMITVAERWRGGGQSLRLLDGIAAHEYRAGQQELALEVLADNRAARRAYARAHFESIMTATIMTGPV